MLIFYGNSITSAEPECKRNLSILFYRNTWAIWLGVVYSFYVCVQFSSSNIHNFILPNRITMRFKKNHSFYKSWLFFRFRFWNFSRILDIEHSSLHKQRMVYYTSTGLQSIFSTKERECISWNFMYMIGL